MSSPAELYPILGKILLFKKVPLAKTGELLRNNSFGVFDRLNSNCIESPGCNGG